MMMTSSMLAHVNMPGVAAYCATKAMVSSFSEALSFEVRDKIDVTCWEPGTTSTNLFSETEPPPAGLLQSSDKAVRNALC